MQTDILATLAELAEVLERIGLRYVVGGSLASGSWGDPRSTHDVDLLVDLPMDSVTPLLEALAGSFYVDASSVREAVRDKRSFNVIHLGRHQKVDLFVAGQTALDLAQLEHVSSRNLGGPEERRFPITSAEVMILRKLDWYEQGDEVSDRQWRDVLAILRVQGERLDRERLDALADRCGLRALLDRARSQRGS